MIQTVGPVQSRRLGLAAGLGVVLTAYGYILPVQVVHAVVQQFWKFLEGIVWGGSSPKDFVSSRGKKGAFYNTKFKGSYKVKPLGYNSLNYVQIQYSWLPVFSDRRSVEPAIGHQ